jgi:hypothetical protein
MGISERMTWVIAAVVHEANKAYCESLGDMRQKPWAEADKWQKDSVFEGVRFKLDNPTATPEDLHQSWLDQKLADGWRYGPTKDVNKKEHPCMVPYIDLPQSQRIKDYIFGAIVEAFRKGWGE